MYVTHQTRNLETKNNTMMCAEKTGGFNLVN